MTGELNLDLVNSSSSRSQLGRTMLSPARWYGRKVLELFHPLVSSSISSQAVEILCRIAIAIALLVVPLLIVALMTKFIHSTIPRRTEIPLTEYEGFTQDNAWQFITLSSNAGSYQDMPVAIMGPQNVHIGGSANSGAIHGCHVIIEIPARGSHRLHHYTIMSDDRKSSDNSDCYLILTSATFIEHGRTPPKNQDEFNQQMQRLALTNLFFFGPYKKIFYVDLPQKNLTDHVNVHYKSPGLIHISSERCGEARIQIPC